MWTSVCPHGQISDVVDGAGGEVMDVRTGPVDISREGRAG